MVNMVALHCELLHTACLGRQDSIVTYWSYVRVYARLGRLYLRAGSVHHYEVLSWAALKKYLKEKGSKAKYYRPIAACWLRARRQNPALEIVA